MLVEQDDVVVHLGLGDSTGSAVNYGAGNTAQQDVEKGHRVECLVNGSITFPVFGLGNDMGSVETSSNLDLYGKRYGSILRVVYNEIHVARIGTGQYNGSSGSGKDSCAGGGNEGNESPEE